MTSGPRRRPIPADRIHHESFSATRSSYISLFYGFSIVRCLFQPTTATSGRPWYPTCNPTHRLTFWTSPNALVIVGIFGPADCQWSRRRKAAPFADVFWSAYTTSDQSSTFGRLPSSQRSNLTRTPPSKALAITGICGQIYNSHVQDFQAKPSSSNDQNYH